MKAQRLLVVSPVRNEERHIERTVKAMRAQTRPPDLWLVVDDGSEDRTPELLRRIEPEIPFMRLSTAAQAPASGTDRLAEALEARALNGALAQIELEAFTHIGKLDGDIELPADYYEALLAEFAADPRLGIAGGLIEEPTGPGGDWKLTRATESHVQGALRVYSRECFEAAGGIRETLAWDVIDQAYARMGGYRTTSFSSLVARHRRVAGSAEGALRGRRRDGLCAYIARYSPAWVLLRAVKVAFDRRPRGLSGLAFLGGYLGGAARRSERVEDGEFKRFVRAEHRRRLLRRLRPRDERSSISKAGRKQDPARFVG